MLDKQAIKEIPVSPETPRFYSPIFLVAKESGSWRLILNLKAFNKFVVPPSFRMETLRTVMDCLGEAAQQRQNTSEHLRDLSLSITWAISIDLRDAYFHVAVAPEHTRYLPFAYNLWVPGAPLRSVDGSQSLHKDREGHRGLPQSTRCRYAPVLGRLADEKSVKIPSGASPRFDAILGEQAGVPCERGQVPAHPLSGPCLPGFDPGSPEYAPGIGQEPWPSDTSIGSSFKRSG